MLVRICLSSVKGMVKSQPLSRSTRSFFSSDITQSSLPDVGFQLAYSRNDPGEVISPFSNPVVAISLTYSILACFSAILLLVGGGFNAKCATISGLICDSYKLCDGYNKLKAMVG